MKKSIIISTLILLASITSQVQALSVRVAVYENKKNGQLIIVCGDIHTDLSDTQNPIVFDTIEQFHQLILELKRTYKKSNISIVESLNESDTSMITKNIKNIDRRISDVNLFYLSSQLTKANLNTLNIECRNIIQLLSHEINEILFNQQENCINNIFPEPKNFPETILNDIEKNLQNLAQQEIEIFDYLSKESPKTIDYLKEINDKHRKIMEICVKNLKEIYQEILIAKNQLSQKTTCNLNLKDYKNILEKLSKKLDYLENAYTNFIDMNIIYNIIKNKDKKIIVVCAGIAHTSKIEDFLISVDYKLKINLGSEKWNYDFFDHLKAIENPELFAETFMKNTLFMNNNEPIEEIDKNGDLKVDDLTVSIKDIFDTLKKDNIIYQSCLSGQEPSLSDTQFEELEKIRIKKVNYEQEKLNSELKAEKIRKEIKRIKELEGKKKYLETKLEEKMRKLYEEMRELHIEICEKDDLTMNDIKIGIKDIFDTLKKNIIFYQSCINAKEPYLNDTQFGELKKIHTEQRAKLNSEPKVEKISKEIEINKLESKKKYLETKLEETNKKIEKELENVNKLLASPRISNKKIPMTIKYFAILKCIQKTVHKLCDDLQSLSMLIYNFSDLEKFSEIDKEISNLLIQTEKLVKLTMFYKELLILEIYSLTRKNSSQEKVTQYKDNRLKPIILDMGPDLDSLLLDPVKKVNFETLYSDQPTKLFNICEKNRELGLKKDLTEDIENLEKLIKNKY